MVEPCRHLTHDDVGRWHRIDPGVVALDGPHNGRRSGHPVILFPRHRSPNVARQLVGQSDGGHHPGLAGDEAVEPAIRHDALADDPSDPLIAPTISSLRMSVCPILLTPQSRTLLRCLEMSAEVVHLDCSADVKLGVCYRKGAISCYRVYPCGLIGVHL
jgi:hypothetical protein